MTTYHVQVSGTCDVIVEAKCEEDAHEYALERITGASLTVENAVVKGVLSGSSLETAYKYFPEHLRVC